MVVLDGNKTSQAIKSEIADEVAVLKGKGKRKPHLAAVLVGNNGASITYVNWKVKDCEQVGFESTLIKLPDTTSERELLEQIETLNNQDDLDGFIVQLPLPKHIDEQKVIRAIKPEKDVDGFHPENVGKMALNLPTFLPATPAGIIELLDRYNIETGGKHCVVIGRSHIVGMPISILMGRNEYPGNSTVTLTHSRTVNLEEILQTADIVIAAIGKPKFITGSMIKPGAVIIDVGISRIADQTKKSKYRIEGDVDFDSCSKKASFITPVPGGVGPMTRAMLLKNTMLAYKMKD